MRPLLLASLLLSLHAAAQVPGAPLPPGMPPLVAAPSDADRALISASAAAVGPGPLEVRVLAVEDLGLLGDPRAVPLLRRLLLTELQGPLQRAAVRALRALGSEACVSVLDEALRTNRLTHEGARELLASLPYLRWEMARAALVWAAANGSTYDLRAAAGAALARFDAPPVTRDARLEDAP